MRATAILLVTLVFCELINAQTPNWAWAKNGRGAGHDYGQSISTDTSGNCYATGFFQLPSVSFENITLTGPVSHHDRFFLVKYDRSGNLVWARTTGGALNCAGTSVNTDATGNSYVSGYFMQGAVSFGNITLQPVQGSVPEAFIVKYDKDGNVIWAKSAGQVQMYPPYHPIANAIDANGNVYITANTYLLAPAGPGFIKKFDTNGNLIWTRDFTGNTREIRVCTDANGNAYITGTYFNSTLTIGSIILPVSPDGNTIFVAKLDPNGNVLWAKNEGVYGSQYGPSIGADGSGNSYVTGWFLGRYAKFGSIVLNNPSLTHTIFFVKFDTNGNVVWARQSNGTGHANDIKTDINGNSYIGGMFAGGTSFGTITPPSFRHNDVFVAKYNSSGDVIWVKSAGGNNVDLGCGISVNQKGNVFVTGNYFSDSTFFDAATVVNSDSVHFPSEVFIAKLGNNPEDTITEPLRTCTMDLVKVYPNPAKDIITIDKPATACKITMALYNRQGQLIFTGKTLSNGQNVISVFYLIPGIYFYALSDSRSVLLTGSFLKY